MEIPDIPESLRCNDGRNAILAMSLITVAAKCLPIEARGPAEQMYLKAYEMATQAAYLSLLDLIGQIEGRVERN